MVWYGMVWYGMGVGREGGGRGGADDEDTRLCAMVTGQRRAALFNTINAYHADSY